MASLLFISFYLVLHSVTSTSADSCGDLSDFEHLLSSEWKPYYIYDETNSFQIPHFIKDDFHAFISIPDKHSTLSQLIEIENKLKQTEKAQYLPLSFMPIAIKDNINTNNYRTTSATNALADFRPKYNAKIVENLIKAGAVIYGKTNLHEMALGITTCNVYVDTVTKTTIYPPFGCCINAMDGNKSCGGSSGGSAAAVAANYVPVAIGTDTGGSVRIPAAMHNIIGFMPTQHRYPINGVFPLSHSSDKVGVLSKHISFIIDIDDALISNTIINENDFDLNNVRIGVPKKYFLDDVHPNILDSFHLTLHKISMENKVTLIQGNDECFENVRSFIHGHNTPHSAIIGYEFPRDAAHYLDIYGTNLSLTQVLQQSNGFEANFFESLLDPTSEHYITTAKYDTFLRKLDDLRAMFLKYMKENDLNIFVYPTVGIEPPLRIKEEHELMSNGKKFKTIPKMLHNTLPTALSTFPCITIPGIKADRIEAQFKVGFEMCSLPNTDKKLLRLAQIFINIINIQNL